MSKNLTGPVSMAMKPADKTSQDILRQPGPQKGAEQAVIFTFAALGLLGSQR